LTAAREIEDQDVFVIGGGNSAGQAAVHLFDRLTEPALGDRPGVRVAETGEGR